MDELVKWVEDFVGDSFVEGKSLSLSKGIAIVIVKTPNGVEPIDISLPEDLVRRARTTQPIR